MRLDGDVRRARLIVQGSFKGKRVYNLRSVRVLDPRVLRRFPKEAYPYPQESSSINLEALPVGVKHRNGTPVVAYHKILEIFREIVKEQDESNL